ncbi:MAG: biopolymer transporter ExbD [Nitrospirae bacterium]|nr:biopolymer transporter ExbD [Nitrospirota bacterium]
MRTVNPFRKKRNAVSELSLISLMDIFTILLLFLLIHMAGEEMIMPPSEALQLPASTAQKLPKPTIVVMVTRDDIFVEGKRIMGVKEALGQGSDILVPLQKELSRLADRTRFVARENPSLAFTGSITLMGDRQIPFVLLKKVMATGAQAQFRDISLAVMQKDETTLANKG